MLHLTTELTLRHVGVNHLFRRLQVGINQADNGDGEPPSLLTFVDTLMQKSPLFLV